MTMQLVNLVQGGAEWHDHRRNHFNASDAPAMMGASSYKSRSELIKELATGITPEVDAATQRRFDDGHQFEALARPLAEQIIGEDLSPCVGTRGKYSASFDGLTFMNDVAFEHKTLNSTLREIMANGCTGADLPLQYQVQMEQQAMVSGCERILFMASRWQQNQATGEWLLVEEYHCWYEPDAELRAQIIAGWEQIEKDVAAYQPQAAEPKPQPEAKIRDALPVLRIEARGEITTSTLDSFRVEVLERINSVNAVLETDQQFADADADAKWLRDVSSAMKQAGKKVRSDMQSVDDVLNVLEQLDQIATRKAIDLEKRVKSEKDVRKQVIVQEAQQALDVHVDSLNKQLGTYWLPRVAGGFAETIKGLKSLDSMRDKVAVALTNAKLQAQTTANTLLLNRDFLRGDGSGKDWITLFPDFPAMGVKEPEVFKAIPPCASTTSSRPRHSAWKPSVPGSAQKRKPRPGVKPTRKLQPKPLSRPANLKLIALASGPRSSKRRRLKPPSTARRYCNRPRMYRRRSRRQRMTAPLQLRWPPTCQALSPSRLQKALRASTLNKRSALLKPALQLLTPARS